MFDRCIQLVNIFTSTHSSDKCLGHSFVSKVTTHIDSKGLRCIHATTFQQLEQFFISQNVGHV